MFRPAFARAFFFPIDIDTVTTDQHWNPTIPCFYLTPKQDDFNKIPELQVCIAEALYDADAVLSNPSAFKPEEIRTLRDQIVSNLERAWEITGRSEDQLTALPFTIRALLLVRSNTLEQSRAN